MQRPTGFQADCNAGDICKLNGICGAPSAGDLPAISNVIGNDPGDTDRIPNGLIVTGTLLATARFELRSADSIALLTKGDVSDTSVEVYLPPGVHSGPHTLVATNDAGSSEADVTLTLPELTGDSIVNRVNSDATTPFVVARMPAEVVTEGRYVFAALVQRPQCST